MNRKIKEILMTLVFGLFLSYYVILIPFTKDSVDTISEKREVNKAPEISIKNYVNISQEFSAFFRDYIPYRTTIKNKYSDFLVNIVGTTSNDSVILGKNEWLFYNSHESDPVTNELIDYNGSKYYSKRQLKNIAKEINVANNVCNENGAKLIFLIAPNKSSVYPQYMSTDFQQTEEYTRIDQLYDYLVENTEACVIYPKKELRRLGEKEKIYYKNDTHWNGLGGYYAASIIMNTLNLPYPTRDEVELVEDISPEDLKLMLGVQNFSADLENFIPNYDVFYHSQMISSSDSLDEYISDNLNGKKLLLLGDSFSEKLIPAFSIAFEEMDASRTRYYQFVQDKKYDYVIYELVERNIAFLAN